MAPKKRKREEDIADDENTKKCKTSSSSTSNNSTSKNINSFLLNHKIFILKAGIEKARLQIFESQVRNYGGKISSELDEEVTHIVVDEKMDVEKLCRLLKGGTPPQHIPVIKSNWLSTCFRVKQLKDIKDYLLDIVINKPEEKKNLILTSIEDTKYDTSKLSIQLQDKSSNSMSNNFNNKVVIKTDVKHDSDSDYVESDVDSDFGEGTSAMSSEVKSDTSSGTGVSPIKNLPVGSWTCARSSKNPKPNVNQAITEKLQEMIRNYESTNDKWRAFGYQKAVQAIKSHTKPITSWEEARNLRGVGTKLADKIWEIVQSGELRKLNEFKSSDDIKVLNLFTDVWGAGPTTARSWYQQGFRSLDDLMTKAKLTYQQKVGVRLYDDLLDRMPRSEAGEIETVVRETAESLQCGIIAQACGSYRRGKTTCGDVDVLITHPDGKSHRGIFTKLINKLTKEGFLTDHLVSVEDSENQKKYLGVCKLKGDNRKHRRLDIIVVPYEEYGCALVYFTGSAHFNRSLRHLAKQMNMSLNEHALKYGVVRKGTEKIHEGTVIPTPTEKSVFEKFNIPYRPPEERDH